VKAVSGCYSPQQLDVIAGAYKEVRRRAPHLNAEEVAIRIFWEASRRSSVRAEALVAAGLGEQEKGVDGLCSDGSAGRDAGAA